MTRKTGEDHWALVARWAASLFIVAVSMAFDFDTTNAGAIVTVLLAGAVFRLMKLKAKREQESQFDAAELRTSAGATADAAGADHPRH